MTVAEVLRAAAKRLREQGWTQHGLGDHWKDTGPCCMVGAIFWASARDMDKQPAAVDAVRKAIRFNFLADWNDRPDRTADEVIAILETTAAQLEST